MTEISFARSFLSALDSRPMKLSSDHISDPRQLPSGAVYVLPKYASSPAKRKRDTPTATAGAAASSSRPALLKNMKNDKFNLELDVDDGMSIFDLKTEYGAKWGVPVEKIKLLFSKKPVADSKTVKDVAGEVAGTIEFTIMLLGGVVPTEKSEQGDQVAAVGPHGKALETDEFWHDLKGFLIQRLKDPEEGERLVGVFRKAAS